MHQPDLGGPLILNSILAQRLLVSLSPSKASQTTAAAPAGHCQASACALKSSADTAQSHVHERAPVGVLAAYTVCEQSVCMHDT